MKKISTEVVIKDDHTIAIKGEISFAILMRLYDESIKLIHNKKSITIDFSKARLIDDSALALMTSIWRFTRKNKIKLKYTNLPKKLIELVALGGLNDVFTIS